MKSVDGRKASAISRRLDPSSETVSYTIAMPREKAELMRKVFGGRRAAILRDAMISLAEIHKGDVGVF